MRQAEAAYSSLAARMAWSAGRSWEYLDDAGQREFDRLVTVEHLWGFCLITAGWFLISRVPWVGPAVNLYLAWQGLKEVEDRLERTGSALSKWYHAAYDAKAMADLEIAARHFADAAAVGGFALFEFVISHAAAKYALTKLLRRFPPPKWLRELWAKVRTQREVKKEAGPKKPAPTTSEAGRLRPEETLRRLSGEAPLLLRAEGAKQQAAALPEFPTAAVVAGSVGVLAVAGLLYVALHED